MGNGDATSKGTSGWTTETLKEHFDVRFTALEGRLQETKEETAAKFRGVNEFRGALDDAQRTLMPRAEYESSMNDVRKRIDSLEDERLGQRGAMMGKVQGWGWAVAVVMLALAVFLGLRR